MRNFFRHGFTEGEDAYVYVKDHLGSVWQVVDDDGETVTSRTTYGPWGEQSITGAGPHSSFGYTGHFNHSEPTEIALAQYRGYHARLGRWLSRDPLGAVNGPNIHAYVGNAPTMRVDPDGRNWLLDGLRSAWEWATSFDNRDPGVPLLPGPGHKPRKPKELPPGKKPTAADDERGRLSSPDGEGGGMSSPDGEGGGMSSPDGAPGAGSPGVPGGGGGPTLPDEPGPADDDWPWPPGGVPPGGGGGGGGMPSFLPLFHFPPCLVAPGLPMCPPRPDCT